MRKNFSHGFTLIELLVVIGVLGILAGTLFFVIDPLEQLKRGEDAAKKRASETFATAMTSYYVTHMEYPWQNGACTDPETNAFTLLASGTTVNGCVTELIASGDLKDTFDDDLDTLSKIRFSRLGKGFATCFDPESQTESNNTPFRANGTTSGGSGITDYWCVIQ